MILIYLSMNLLTPTLPGYALNSITTDLLQGGFGIK